MILNSFKNIFATPAFLRHMEHESVEIKPFIARNALVGLNKPKMMILKEFSLLLDTDFRAFSTEYEAVQYLIEETVIEKLEPIFKNLSKTRLENHFYLDTRSNPSFASFKLPSNFKAV